MSSACITDAKVSSRILSRHWWIALLSKITTLVFCVFAESKYTASWSSVCWASFVKFSDKVVQHCLLSSVVGDFCIICKLIILFQPKTFYKYLFSAVKKAPCLYVHDQIYDIKDFFNFPAFCVKVENFNATGRVGTLCYHIFTLFLLQTRWKIQHFKVDWDFFAHPVHTHTPV